MAAFFNKFFRQYEGRIKTSCEVWLKNEGLAVRESLHELYNWFMKERGIDIKLVSEDLNILGEQMALLPEGLPMPDRSKAISQTKKVPWSKE